MNETGAPSREALRALARIFTARGDVTAVFRLPEAHQHADRPGPKTFDLGVLFHPLVDGNRYEELRLEIAALAAVELARTDIRVIVLNDMTPNLGYDLVRRGYPVYIGSDERVREYENRVQNEFLRSIHDHRARVADNA